MSVHWGGRGPGHTSRKPLLGAFSPGGTPVDPSSYTPALKFNDARNSQYRPLLQILSV